VKTEQMNKQAFFKHLYQHCDGMLEIRPLPQGRKRAFFQPDDHDGIEKHCKRFEKSDLYFGVATRDGQGGKKANIIHIPAVWSDCDFKQIEKEKLAKNVRRFPFRPSIVVCSGGGLHIYWMLKEPSDASEIPIIEDVNIRIADFIGGDRAAIDAARVLRVPDTCNHKYPSMATLHKINPFFYSLDNFLELLPKVKQPFNDLAGCRSSSNTENIETKALYRFRKCLFIRWCENHPAEVSEPLWYALVSNAICVRPGGYSFCHHLSRGYPGYSKKETDLKILQALDASAPHTCTFIRSKGFSCGKSCNVKSPAGLLLRTGLKPKHTEGRCAKTQRASVSFS